jgi:hypothetical protein
MRIRRFRLEQKVWGSREQGAHTMTILCTAWAASSAFSSMNPSLLRMDASRPVSASHPAEGSWRPRAVFSEEEGGRPSSRQPTAARCAACEHRFTCGLEYSMYRRSGQARVDIDGLLSFQSLTASLGSSSTCSQCWQNKTVPPPFHHPAALAAILLPEPCIAHKIVLVNQAHRQFHTPRTNLK